MGKEILAEEAAKIAGVGRRTFAAYAARGQAPAPIRRVGRTPLWDEDEIRDWVEHRPGRGSRTTERALRRAAERLSSQSGQKTGPKAEEGSGPVGSQWQRSEQPPPDTD